MSASTGCVHGSSSLALIGPPMKASPAKGSADAGTGSPSSSFTSFQGTRLASRNVAKWPGPSVSEKRKTATGFTMRAMFSWASILAAAAAFPAHATDVTVVGLFSGKAVVTINRGAPRTLAVGQAAAEGVKLIAVDAKGATFEIDGKRQVLEMGQHFETAAAPGERASVTLAPDSRGHFVADAQVNGAHMRLLVDTGATNLRLAS